MAGRNIFTCQVMVFFLLRSITGQTIGIKKQLDVTKKTVVSYLVLYVFIDIWFDI